METPTNFPEKSIWECTFYCKNFVPRKNCMDDFTHSNEMKIFPMNFHNTFKNKDVIFHAENSVHVHCSLKEVFSKA